MNARPVWLTREQRENWAAISAALRMTGHVSMANMLDERIIGAWDVAPADSLDDAEMAYRSWHRAEPGTIGSGVVKHLLVTLGMPDA